MLSDVRVIQDKLPPVLQQRWPEAWQQLQAHSTLAAPTLQSLHDSILTLWAYSQYAADLFNRKPALLAELIATDPEQVGHSRAAMQARLLPDFANPGSDEAGLMRTLRQVRHRELLRIAWRDLNALAALQETLQATSDLADLLIQTALDWCYAAQVASMGVPTGSSGADQQLVVLGMGKLGGRELNFSSDIDLIFAYPESGETRHRAPKENSVFFTRLGQRLIQVLGKANADGFVYRVDMRLRPFGDSGALVMNFDATEHYYEVHGREWERYALLKARPVAGDLEAGEELLQRLRGFIYRRYIDYSVLEHLREMKSMIARQAEKKGLEQSIKLGPGGIREIEFSTQVFQLVGGGRDRKLQQRSLFGALAHIGELGMLSSQASEELTEAYIYLRLVENRVQMEADQQTHVLPSSELGCWRLHRAMGEPSWAAFMQTLDQYRRQVRVHFTAIFAEQSEDAEAAPGLDLWQFARQGRQITDQLMEQGCPKAAELSALLVNFAQDLRRMGISEQGQQRLDRVMQLLLPELMVHAEVEQAAARMLELLKAVARRSVYFSMLYEHPQAISQLVTLCASSQWVTDQLVRFPVLLDELLDPLERAEPPQRAELQATLEAEFQRVASDDEEALLNVFRHFKSRQVLRVAATDVLDLFPVMKVSDRLTWIAEVLLDKALEMAWARLVQRHGQPRCKVDGEWRYPTLGIVAYGKLGGIELGYSSDLDLVFVHDSVGEQQNTDGEKSIDNATFFARVVQRLVNIMTVFTAAGSVYEIDLRLRPSGNSGLLVSTLEGFDKYQRENAWTWEHQALVRARYVSAAGALADGFEGIRQGILSLPREAQKLRIEVREMREKMWQEHGVAEPGRFHLKKSPGGITDIEFMVQYMVLAHAADYPELCRWTDNVRLLQTLAATGLLDSQQAAALEESYRHFRDELHHLKLRGLPSSVGADRLVSQRAFVQQCWQQILG